MSNGFRIFLLILLASGAIAMYRFRRPELDQILYGITPHVDAGATSTSTDRARGAARPPAENPFAEPLQLADEGPSRWREGVWRPESQLELIPWDGDDGVAFGGSELVDDVPDAVPEPTERHEADPDLIEGADLEGERATGDGLVEPRRLGVYKVEQDDRLWTLAEQFLGRGDRYPELIALNRDQLESEHDLRAGMVLRIPFGTGEPKGAEKIPDRLKFEREENDTTVEPSSDLNGSRPARRTHRVAARETLTKIARRYFPGDPRGADLIFEANRDQVSSPDRIREGQVLVIPPREGG